MDTWYSSATQALPLHPSTAHHTPPSRLSSLLGGCGLPRRRAYRAPKCHCVTFPPFAFGPRAGPFSNSSALQIARIYLPSFYQALCQCGERTWKRAGPGYFEHISLSLSLPPCYSPKGRGGGGIYPTQPYGYRSLAPAPLELPSPSGGFPPKDQARPMNFRQDMSLAVTRGTPPLQTTSLLHRNVLGLSPNGQLCRKRGWQALWVTAQPHACGTSHTGPGLHAAMEVIQIRESAWPCWDMAELWRPPTMAARVLPFLAALHVSVTFAQQPSAPCTRLGPSSQVRRARSFVLTRSIPSPSPSLIPEPHLI